VLTLLSEFMLRSPCNLELFFALDILLGDICELGLQFIETVHLMLLDQIEVVLKFNFLL